MKLNAPEGLPANERIENGERVNVEAAVLSESLLGKTCDYKHGCYSSAWLFALPRMQQRASLSDRLLSLAQGEDVWNGYELSWLDSQGKPMVAIARFVFDCQSPNLVESKSFKLYLNSLNDHRFDSPKAVSATLAKDLSSVSGAPVSVDVVLPKDWTAATMRLPDGESVDEQTIAMDCYAYQPAFLRTESEVVEEILYSNLLKSNCLVTGQPDWATVSIRYRGLRLDRAALLRYIVSFRHHHEFHEHCVERIFVDIMERCKPERLVVEASYTRRGGLDINPIRAFGYPVTPAIHRLTRQ